MPHHLAFGPAQRGFTAGAFCWLLFLVGYGAGTAIPGAATLPSSTHRFVVIAHRGDHEHAHENTLTAIRAAARVGADYVEVDVRQTRDGHLVLMHDATVDRMTDGSGRVAELDLDAIRRLRVTDETRPELAPDRVPTFDEALSAMKGRIHLYLDFKAGERTAVVAALRRHEMMGNVVVYDDVANLPRWREVAPGLPLMTSLPDEAREPASARAFLTAGSLAVLDGPVTDYTAPLVAAVSEAGARVWPDIQGPWEGPDLWARAVALGIGGLQTDRPSDLVQWLDHEGLR
ncbi:MAG: glycerophosphodiester phosphodiesterase family protein [Verrucomicrobiales bacterium]|nr:glycerophosphodiester phosphodiesterase family protein [Verrucomicrobiales bacterium]MCP5526005.1 glycerophosphodiester phosphodiesterase family protein [Verrucomicrobiales bacterium]